VDARQPTMLSCGVQSRQLLAESQIFKDEFLTGTKGGNNPAGQMPEEGDHAPKSYRNRPAVLCALWAQVIHFTRAQGFDEPQPLNGPISLN
jgi:hypothetical protein